MFKDLKSNVRKVSELMLQDNDYYVNYRWKIKNRDYIFRGVIGRFCETPILELRYPGDYMQFYPVKNGVKIKYNHNFHEFTKEIKSLEDLCQSFDWEEENVMEFIKHLEFYAVKHI